MTTIEIVTGALLLLTCLCIIVAVTLQSGRSDGMSSVIMGGDGGSVKGRSKDSDAKLAKITKILAVVLFVVTLAVSIISLSK